MMIANDIDICNVVKVTADPIMYDAITERRHRMIWPNRQCVDCQKLGPWLYDEIEKFHLELCPGIPIPSKSHEQ